MINTITPANSIVQTNDNSGNDPLRWLTMWDPAAALDSVRDHVEALPSSRNERNTMRAYLQSLADFAGYCGAWVDHLGGESYECDFSLMQLPTKALMTNYIAYCKRRGLTSKTVGRYLASVRLFLKTLEEQQVIPQNGSDFVFILEVQRQLKIAAGVQNPKSDTVSSVSALEEHGTRLDVLQVDKIFAAMAAGSNSGLPDVTTITGKRDLALMYIGFTSAFRAAELARITLGSITQADGVYLIRVRGKRAKIDPVPADATAIRLLTDYVEAFNERLADDDPRRIERDTPVFQPILHGDNIPALGLRGNKSDNGISPRAILKIVARRSEAALGFPITAHDMRRTCAYIMRQKGYEFDAIQLLLRHESVATTEKYVGRNKNYSGSLLSSRVQFNVPTDKRLV